MRFSSVIGASDQRGERAVHHAIGEVFALFPACAEVFGAKNADADFPADAGFDRADGGQCLLQLEVADDQQIDIAAGVIWAGRPQVLRTMDCKSAKTGCAVLAR